MYKGKDQMEMPALMTHTPFSSWCTVAFALAVASVLGAQSTTPAAPDQAALETMTARFAPTEITADVSGLPAGERKALGKLVQASRIIDALFLRQVWAGNDALLLRLLTDVTPLGRARLHAFLVDKGPWSRLDHEAPFIPGVPVKPGGANFYPAGATKVEVEAWIAGLPADERQRATGFFTTVRRTPPGSPQPFVVVPYSLEYQGELARAADLLREAAAQTAQPTLKRFLETRAAAFLSNDYYESDVAWMELDASIEPTIGPYEVYEDQWFNYKAAFESFITVRDEAESEKLARFSSELQEIENHLPIDPALRNPSLGALAPIRVVNEIFAAGDANRGVQTAAFNLPNDERVVKAKGTKRVMLKNVQEAKFRIVLLPISTVALAPADRAHVVFDAFFTHILMHELMHGLGPHNIRVGGRETTVRQELKETLQRDRGGQGGRIRAMGPAVSRGQGFVAEHNAGHDVHDVSRIGIPIDPLRRERGARAGNGDSVERVAGRRGVPRGRRRHVQRRPGPDSPGGDLADTRSHDAAGGGRLRTGTEADRTARRAAPRGEAGARSSRRGAGRYRAPVPDRRTTRAGVMRRRPRYQHSDR